MAGRDTPQDLPVGMIPQLDYAITIATGQQPPIGTKGRRPDLIVLLGPDLEAAAALQVPQSDRAIIAACRQEPARGMTGYAPDPPGVAPQDAHTLPAADLPHLHLPIVASAHQQRPLRIEDQRVGQPAMSLERKP